MEERQRPQEIVVKKVRPGGVRVRAEARIFRWMLRTARTPPGPYISVGNSQGRGRSSLALGSPRPPLRGEQTTFESAVSILCFRLQTEFWS